MHRYLIAAIFLSACVPVVDRADCTDGDVRKDNCDRNRITRTIVDNPPQPEPEPEPEPEEPGGHWATRENEPDSRTDPEGHALKCLDGDRANTDPANWVAVPRALLPRLNGRFGRGYDAAPEELKPAIMAIAKLEHRAREARKEVKE